ncbi:hypothetical protein ACFOOM_11035 [Streptomyces echinoruber]|uniref:Uncharacterized protein n=1 Tax=Streptomyces echinoruber TaxID=68898 RepID=A0A918VNB6_9ACTN|nr:hypothetical protein [Streptomyces echinoruber]GHA14858.1 hypothetical protein GCM10010389_61990 [Streptomyces echinoruber]
MSTTSTSGVSASELRRRVRAIAAFQAKTRELAAADALAKRKAAQDAAKEKERADRAAREAVAAVLRLYDNDAELVANLLGVPAEELEREAKPVTAARAKEVIETLQTRAERRRPRRPGLPVPPAASAPNTAAPSPSAVSDHTPADAG